jgi:hypothetical protein
VAERSFESSPPSAGFFVGVIWWWAVGGVGDERGAVDGGDGPPMARNRATIDERGVGEVRVLGEGGEAGET